MSRYIEDLERGTLFFIRFDETTKRIKEVDIKSKEEFELECILFLDEYQRTDDIDMIIYTKDEVIYTYDNRKENIIKRR